jgi:hypothetical protein
MDEGISGSSNEKGNFTGPGRRRKTVRGKQKADTENDNK